ncbi:MAG TPA: efflux RND transporter periplasmic adaptor subunit [Candidatus Binatia bacterium]|jgi:RND family efflux transporter MFP subunit|nr:efflux RND transporter periplasmic adaptor subunit [Candidatus Binatia bacterium]
MSTEKSSGGVPPASFGGVPPPESNGLPGETPRVDSQARRRRYFAQEGIVKRIRQLTRQTAVLAQRLGWRAGGIILLAAISILAWRLMTAQAKSSTTAPTPAQALPVAVARIVREDLYNAVTIPAEFRPYLKVELHAKVSGYVDRINVDIGDEVRTGQLLARLEVPELRDELARAKAAQQRAEADYKDAHLVYTRLQAVNKDHPNLVAQQELDAAEARDATAEAAIAGAKADAQKYQTLLDYTRIAAPFDGVITHRYADPGSLIQAGTASDTQSMPLVCLSDNYRLRLDIAVSVDNVKDIKLGDTVEVRVQSLNDKTFTGTISRVTQKVDDETRTMITEIDVPNPKLELVPGMYAKVVLKVERRPQALAVPTEAISTDENTTVYVVNSEQELEERPVTLGLETPTKYEVLAGLKEGDLVLIGRRSQVKPGQKVEAKLLSSLAQQ